MAVTMDYSRSINREKLDSKKMSLEYERVVVCGRKNLQDLKPFLLFLKWTS